MAAAVIGTKAVLKINGIEVGMVESAKEIVRCATEGQLVTIGPVKAAGTFKISPKDRKNLERLIRETYPNAKKHKAQGRRVMKNNTLRAERNARRWAVVHPKEYVAIDATHLTPPPPAINCLKDCPKRGTCCQLLTLWVGGRPWPETQDSIEAQEAIDNWHGGALPFRVFAHGVQMREDGTATDQHCWYLACRMQTEDGACGIYEQRPEVCRIFTPGGDKLCACHPEHEEARVRYLKGVGELIGEVGNTPTSIQALLEEAQQKGGDAP